MIVDEFGELLEAEPAFADIFNAIGRMGRSLGVHLLLATQRLDEGRVRSLEPHLRYRLGLRTFSAAESRSVLGSAAAYELPPVPGLGYLAVDESLTRFKAAITTLPDRPAAPGTKPAGHRRPPAPHPAAPRARRTVAGRRHSCYDIGRGRLCRPGRARPPSRDRAERSGPGRLGSRRGAGRRIWLSPLPAAVTLGALTQAPLPWPVGRRPSSAWSTSPAVQRQTAPRLGPRRPGGNLGVAGAPRTGKSTLLHKPRAGARKRSRADEVQFYCLDLGGGGLFALEGLPHVGAIVGPGEVEAANRLLQDMRSLVSERAAAETIGGQPGRPGRRWPK